MENSNLIYSLSDYPSIKSRSKLNYRKLKGLVNLKTEEKILVSIKLKKDWGEIEFNVSFPTI